MNSFCKSLALAFVVFAFMPSVESSADEGQPVAIRHWPGGGFTVETMWDLHVGVGLGDEAKSQLPREVDEELEELPGLKGVVCTLFRDANDDETQLVEKPLEKKSNAMLLTLSKAYETKEHRNARPLSFYTTVAVDGIQIQFLDHDKMKMDQRQERLKRTAQYNKQKEEGKNNNGKEDSDLVRNDYVVVATGEQFTAQFCLDYAKAYKPLVMIVNSSIKEIGDSKVEAIAHNTLAVSKQKTKAKTTRFVSLEVVPYEMSKEFAELFAKKEAASKDSREMFAKLSIEQMNFKPANGSHTPRWNVEHMMGRELIFFSQIYNAVDPLIPVMNLNPKQMPDDYEFAHEDWTGKEEARQMERVERFTRRFAYLLDGMDLDKKPKGSRIWTPRSLLKQMERHYKEHSANVVKKMELDGWPKK